jgi:ribulose-phosphate 3-epimerase
MKKIEIFPSLISADLMNLEQVIKELEPHCNGFHIDVMDDHFVPNLTWGPQFVNALAGLSEKPLFVHLMVEEPLRMVERLSLKPGSIVSFHIEAECRINEMKQVLDAQSLISSAAISPKTPLEKIGPFIDTVDQILLMSVNPGFSGQPFLPDSIERLDWLANFRKTLGKDFIISMDGGINRENIGECAKHGATSFGIASGIFSEPNPVAALQALYKIAQDAK